MPAENRMLLTIEAENRAKESFRSLQEDLRRSNTALEKTDKAVNRLSKDGRQLGDTLRQMHQGAGLGALPIERGVSRLISELQRLQREIKTTVAEIDELNNKSLDASLTSSLLRRGDNRFGVGRTAGIVEQLRNYFDKALGDNYQPLPQRVVSNRSFAQNLINAGELPPTLPARRIGTGESLPEFASQFPDYVESGGLTRLSQSIEEAIANFDPSIYNAIARANDAEIYPDLIMNDVSLLVKSMKTA